MGTDGNYLLAIESAIAGGSVAIFADDKLVLSRCGEGSVSRAEDLLPNIIAMLDEADIPKVQLFRIAVSIGPGSFTGLRIGIATAMGLKRGLGIDYVGVPLFHALASGFSDAVIAVPMGKSDICLASSGSLDSPRVVSSDAFLEIVLDERPAKVLVHPAIAEKLNESMADLGQLEALNPNLAEYIGLAALKLPASDQLDPIYIQNPRFG